MLGSAANGTGKRVRITVEIEEERKDALLRLLREAETTSEVVSVRRVQNARKRFAVPNLEDEPTPVTPVRLFPRRADLHTPLPVAIPPDTSTDEDSAPELPACDFCLRAPCITRSDFKPQGRCNARITNHTKRRKDYKWYWGALKANGLWENPTYLERKQELGCLIDDVREVMPHCVIKDVRDRWPNPPNIPYQGHRRS